MQGNGDMVPDFKRREFLKTSIVTATGLCLFPLGIRAGTVAHSTRKCPCCQAVISEVDTISSASSPATADIRNYCPNCGVNRKTNCHEPGYLATLDYLGRAADRRHLRSLGKSGLIPFPNLKYAVKTAKPNFSIDQIRF